MRGTSAAQVYSTRPTGAPAGGDPGAGALAESAAPCPARSKPSSTPRRWRTTCAVRARPRRVAQSGRWSRPMPTATASSAPTRACRGADGFALLDLDEAQRVRALGWRGPILLLEGCFEPRDLELCSRLDLWHTVHHEAQIDMLAAHKTNAPHRVFLKMNSGMNRLGFRPPPTARAWQRLSGLTQVDEITLMTHFADADGAARRGRAAGRLRGRHARAARRALAEQQRGDAALRRCRRRRRAVRRRLGAPRHHGLRLGARLPGARRAPTGTCSRR